MILLALLMMAPCAFPDAKSVGETFQCNDHKYYWDGAAWKAAKPLVSTADNVFTWKGPSAAEPTDCSFWRAQEVDGHCEMNISFPPAKNLACAIENDGYTVKCVWDKPKKEKHEDVSPKK